jgi:hypothetical protein
MSIVTFKKKCTDVGERLGINVEFFDDPKSPADEFEDDGTLHVRRYGWRAVFDVSDGQSVDGAMQNANTRDVLARLGIKPKKEDRVLVEEFRMTAQDLYEYLGALPERQRTDLTVKFIDMVEIVVSSVTTVKTEPETDTLWLVYK